MAELINIKKGETWNDVEFDIDTAMIGGFYFFVGSYNTTNRIRFRKENNRYVFYQMKGNVPTKDVLINVSPMANPTEPLFENIPVSTFISKPIIATATSTVSNGKSSTSTLNYSQGYSRSNLIPGNTYQINGAYQENNHYSYAEGIGTLEMLKCNTTTTLSGNSQIPVGESLTITAIVKENDENTSLSRGSLKLYDGNSLVQTIPVTNTTTSISYTSNVAGTHDLYVIYEDSGIEYNTSTSNHLNVTVTKLEMIFDIQEITNTDYGVINDEGMIVGEIEEIIEIEGYLTYANDNGLHGSVGELYFNLYDYNGSLIDTIGTDTDGSFVFEYEIPSELANEQVITLNYGGNNILGSASLEIPIMVNQPFSFLSLDDYSWTVWSGITTPQPVDPSITTDNVNNVSQPVIQVGRHNCVVLEKTIPIDVNNFVLDVTMKAGNNNDVIFLGKYRILTTGEHAGQYNIPTSYAFGIRPRQVDVSVTDYAHWHFVFKNGVCTLYINSVNTGLTYDFSNYTDDFRLMFISSDENSIKIANISWGVPLEIYDATNWEYILSSSVTEGSNLWGTQVLPTISNEYNCGRYYFNLYTDYPIQTEYTNKRIYFCINSNATHFITGLGYKNNNGTVTGRSGSYTTQFEPNNHLIDTYDTTGIHTISYLFDKKGVVKCFYDGELTTLTSSSLPNKIVYPYIYATRNATNSPVNLMGLTVENYKSTLPLSDLTQSAADTYAKPHIYSFEEKTLSVGHSNYLQLPIPTQNDWVLDLELKSDILQSGSSWYAVGLLQSSSRYWRFSEGHIDSEGTYARFEYIDSVTGVQPSQANYDVPNLFADGNNFKSIQFRKENNRFKITLTDRLGNVEVLDKPYGYDSNQMFYVRHSNCDTIIKKMKLTEME